MRVLLPYYFITNLIIIKHLLLQIISNPMGFWGFGVMVMVIFWVKEIIFKG